MNEAQKKYFFFAVAVLLMAGIFLMFTKANDIRVVESVSSNPIPIPVPLESASNTLLLPEEETRSEYPVMVLFAGDMMFDRYIRTQSDIFGKREVLSAISEKLLSADMVVANLEGPITSNLSKSVGSTVGEARNFLFTFDPEWARVLFDMNIRIVNIGNNHILNFGESGLVETRNFLREAGVKLFGDPLDESLRAYVAEVKGKSIGFVNYNQFYREGESRALLDIERIRPDVDALFVYTHWGAEYVSATSEQKRLARLFIDRGADVIIGSHPHVVQEKEVYQGKTIYYSLGNFVFDQYFRPEVKHGLLVEATISPDNAISFRDISITLSSDGRTKVVKD